MEEKRFANYTIDLLQRTKLGAFVEEVRTTYVVEKRLSQIADTSSLYTLTVKDFKCINPNPSALRLIESDLKELQKTTRLWVNGRGHITGLLNLAEIRAMWDSYQYELKQKHKANKDIKDIISAIRALLGDKQEFLRNFTESDLAVLLFPPAISGLPKETELCEVKTYSGFFEDIPLLLELKNKVETTAEKSHLKRFGTLLDDENYQMEIVRYFRGLTDMYNLSALPTVSYIETFDFDKEQWLTHAGQVFRVEVANLFDFQQLARVKPLEN